MLLLILIFLATSTTSIYKRHSSSSRKGHKTRDKTPKNIILFIADGFGINANAAYRLWKDVDSTIFDEHLVGEYSTNAIFQAVSDSANTATALASGILANNSQIGTDLDINPVATILEAAKKQGKGVGVISTARVTHATPAAFTSKAYSRSDQNLIAEQQGTRIIGDVDILFGGGKRHFIPSSQDGSQRPDDFDLISDFADYGWGSLVQTKDELLSLNENDIPSIGLFTLSHLPSYLQRKNMPDTTTAPGLLDMTKKGLELLTANYKDTGFFLMIESAQIDFAGHFNDLGYMMNEVDEYAITVDYVINDFVKKRRKDDTLVVMVTDHETGGLSLGRATLTERGAPQTFYSVFDFDPLIPPPFQCDESTPHPFVSQSLYQFYVEPLDFVKLEADLIGDIIVDIEDGVDFTETFELIEMYYTPELTDGEKAFIESCWHRNRYRLYLCLTKILNVRINAGWTTLGHTANDLRICASGPGSDIFRGWNGNIENIGSKLIDVFDVEEEINVVLQELMELFVDGTLELCEPSGVPQIPWPEDNYRYPGYCDDVPT